MSRPLVAAVAVPLLLVAALVGLLVAAPVAGAQSSPSATGTVSATTVPDLSQCVNSEPLPNCGRKPQTSGDPGGAGQLLLFALLVFATLLIGVVIARSTIRVTRARNRQLT